VTCVAPALAIPNVRMRFQAHGQLESTAVPNTFRASDLEMQLVESIAGDETAGEGGWGTLTCKPRRYAGMACPAKTAKVTIEDAPGYAASDPTVGRGFAHFSIGLAFGNADCALDAFSPFGLGGPLEFGPKLRPPTMFFGTYVCTSDGSEIDRGTFTIWQHGLPHREPTVDGF
jgi:hypothetical protein